MIALLFYFISIFEYQEPGGINSAILLSSIGNSQYIATAVNPAILTQLDKNGFGIVYCRPFDISLIQYNRLTANYKNFGISFSRLGQTGYQEYNLSLCAGFNFNTDLSYGIIFKGLYLDLGEYGQSFIPALNLGFSYKIDKFRFGSVLENINNPLSYEPVSGQNSAGEDIPWTILAGAIYEPVSDFLIGVDLCKTAQDENITFGTELKPLPILAVRLGTKTNPFIISGGLGITFKNLSFDYTLKFHSRLRQTSILSLGYFW